MLLFEDFREILKCSVFTEKLKKILSGIDCNVDEENNPSTDLESLYGDCERILQDLYPYQDR